MPSRPASLRLLTACLLAGLAAPAQAQDAAVTRAEPAAPSRAAEPPRLSDGDLRGADGDLTQSQRRLDVAIDAEPAGDPATRLRDPGLDLDRPAEDAPFDPDLDLFAGPEEPPAPRRMNLPDERISAASATQGPGARPVSRIGTREGEDAARRPETRLFDPIGPVRSPVLDDVAGLRRLDTSLSTLRRSAPRGAGDPFAAEGVRAGRFVVLPTVEQSVGVSSNLTNTRDGASGAFSQTTLGVRVLSDWSRHAGELNASATYRRNFSGRVEEEPEILADGRLGLDLGPDLAATLRGALSLRRDDGFVTGGSGLAANERDILTYSGAAELARTLGPATGALTLEAVREDREADTLFGADGATPFRGDDSFTTYTAGLRAGYEIGPLLQPFATASVGRRLFDDDRPGTSLSRDSVIPALRAGLGFDAGEKWRGEVALGYAWNLPDEEALRDRGSPTLDASLAWSPRRGTDIGARVATYFEPDASGGTTSTLYQGTLTARHRATARLDLDALGLLALRDDGFTEFERTWGAEAGVTYWLNHRLALIGRYRYDRFDGRFSDYDANTIRVGVRLQR